MAAQLHLGIDAAEIFDLALVVDAAEVSGAVDAARGIVGEWEEVGDELRFRQFPAVEITFGDADAGDADFTRCAERQGFVALRVKNDDRVSRQRLADGDGLLRAKLAERRGDGGFGRP